MKGLLQYRGGKTPAYRADCRHFKPLDGWILMGKYDPLTEYLRHQRKAELTLTFVSIEHLIKEPLPRASQSVNWWQSNPAEDPQKHIQQRSWQSAGFNAYLKPGGRVHFVKGTKTSDPLE
jgi:hypothetical protein